MNVPKHYFILSFQILRHSNTFHCSHITLEKGRKWELKKRMTKLFCAWDWMHVCVTSTTSPRSSTYSFSVSTSSVITYLWVRYEECQIWRRIINNTSFHKPWVWVHHQSNTYMVFSNAFLFSCSSSCRLSDCMCVSSFKEAPLSP